MKPLSGPFSDSAHISTPSMPPPNSTFARVPVIQAVQQQTLGAQANQARRMEPVTLQTSPLKELAPLLQNRKISSAAPLNPIQINQILNRLARINPASIDIDEVMDIYKLLIDLLQSSLILPQDASSLFSSLLVLLIVHHENLDKTLNLLVSLIPDKLPPLTPDAHQTLMIRAQRLSLDHIHKFARHPDLKRMLPRDPNEHAQRICDFLICYPEEVSSWQAVPKISGAGLLKGIDKANSLNLQKCLRDAVDLLKNEQGLTAELKAAISEAIRSLREGGCLNHFPSTREKTEFDKLCKELYSTDVSTPSMPSLNLTFARLPVFQAVHQRTRGPQANQPSPIEPVTLQTNQDPLKELALLLENRKVSRAAPLNPDRINPILDRLDKMDPASIDLIEAMKIYRLLIDLLQSSIILPHEATLLFSHLLVLLIDHDAPDWEKAIYLLVSLKPDKLPTLTPDAHQALTTCTKTLSNLAPDLIQKFAGHPVLKRMLPRDPNQHVQRICEFLMCYPEEVSYWQAIFNISGAGLLEGIDRENSTELQKCLRKVLFELKNEQVLTAELTAAIAKAIRSLREGGCLNHFSSNQERAEFNKLCSELYSTDFSTPSVPSQKLAFTRLPVFQAVQQQTLGPQSNRPSRIEPVILQTNQDPLKELALLLENRKISRAATLNPNRINHILGRLERMDPDSIDISEVITIYKLLIDLLQSSIIFPHDVRLLFSYLLVLIIDHDITGLDENLNPLVSLMPDKLPPLTLDAHQKLTMSLQSLNGLGLDLISKFVGHPIFMQMLPSDPNEHAQRICEFLANRPGAVSNWQAIFDISITGRLNGIDKANSLALQKYLREALGALKDEQELTAELIAAISKAVRSLRRGGCIEHFLSPRESTEFERLCWDEFERLCGSELERMNREL